VDDTETLKNDTETLKIAAVKQTKAKKNQVGKDRKKNSGDNSRATKC